MPYVRADHLVISKVIPRLSLMGFLELSAAMSRLHLLASLHYQIRNLLTYQGSQPTNYERIKATKIRRFLLSVGITVNK